MNSRVYAVLCCARFLVAILSTSYLHPDEFFQSSEVIAGDVLGFKDTVRPWEFDPQSPNRSIVPLFFLSGTPFLFLRLLSLQHHPRAVLVAPRLFITALSFLMDWAVFSLLRARDQGSSCPRPPPDSTWRIMCCYATSWVVLVFHSRTFSNSTESILLSLALAVSTGAFPLATTLRRFACFACLCVLGFFVRFSFLIFACPLGLLLLHAEYRSALSLSSLSAGQALRRLLQPLALSAAAAAVLFASIVAVDSRYFGRLTIAPLNNLIYNLDPGNLALHGLHPFYLHATLNMALLFGPLVPLCYLDCAALLCELVRAARRRQLLSATLAKNRAVACAACIVFSLAMLSRAPHQEARFLLPLLSPIVVLLADRRPRTLTDNRALLASWLCFNVALAIFFGFAHQAGVVPALAWAHDQAIAPSQHHQQQPVVAIFWETYSPPVHLAAISSSVPLKIIEASGSLDDAITEALSLSSRCFLVTPRSAARALSTLGGAILRTSFFPHFSGEAPPASSLSELTLDVLELQAA